MTNDITTAMITILVLISNKDKMRSNLRIFKLTMKVHEMN